MQPALCLAFSLCLSALLTHTAAAELETVHFATDDWPPYLVVDQQGQISKGILVELIHEIFARIPDVDAKIHTMPWSRAIVEVRAGRMDALPGLIYSEQRGRHMQYSSPLFSSPSKLVYSQQQFPQGFYWHNKADFIGLKVAAVRDYAMYDKLLTILGDSSKNVIVPVLSDDILIKMVGGNRIKLGAIDELTALYLAEKYQLASKIKFAQPTIAQHNYHIAISKQSHKVELMSTINSIIAELQKEGIVAEILARHRGLLINKPTVQAVKVK